MEGINRWCLLARIREGGQAGRILLEFWQFIAEIERDGAFQAATSRHIISASFVNRSEKSEHRGFSWFVTELDVVFRGIVQAALGSGPIALVEKAFSKLAVGHRQSFFVSYYPVVVEGLLERRDGLFPLPFTSLLHCQVVVENAERTIVT